MVTRHCHPGALELDFFCVNHHTDLKDITDIVNSFLSVAGALPKTQADLVPNAPLPESSIDFKDVNAVVQAFLGGLYKDHSEITGPCTCPSAVTCGTLPCTTGSECGGGLCFSGFCTDACGRCTP